MTGNDDEASGGLYGQYSHEIHEANQQGRDPDDDWDENLPPEKLWTHPNVDAAPDALCDPDEFDVVSNDDGAVEFDCPTVGCDHRFKMHEAFTYQDMKELNGLVECPDCTEPVLGHQGPPLDWTPPSQRPTGPGGGRP